MRTERIEIQAEQALELDQAQFAEWWAHVPPDSFTRLIATMLYRRAYVQGRADGVEVLPRMVGRLLGSDPNPPRAGQAPPARSRAERAS